MDLVRWEPFHELRQQMNRIFNNHWFRGMPFWGTDGINPRVDIYQTDDEVVATAELPGIASRDDVEVTLTENTLSIRGEFKRGAEERQEGYFHSERYYGTFSRTLPLPVEVNPDQARATYKNGILEVRIPKKEPGKRNVYRVDIH
ncbi:Hsp20/alpha crystallin family protein [Desulfofundulus thermocisternus]|uniref:Hsp20/alpha crystallin family protein n=1 Tax=Desulfofundulus thermocisternus TaxID=42471 RepID=UPI0019DBE774|nr:Hsp20/alpha crystallin family protein [Desulfofundulus thermocisternus]MBE3586387.1 Hsp20/alpha crystallin family protein [Thermoanaerobacter sp.]MCS5696694.1 Hsp20/alpha crystallin family protein [Desulfofundulus thermocisternus]